ncbi:hypothetical protein [Fontibacillus sp. BL9]|uniref:hypothetical protein n=1 Tax=Fontibacillus sp. BL9 TaxID=3389971 RepID=UPI00397A6EBF
MKTLFYRIGYGMAFVIINIRVVIDLMPNVIGYLMILSALSGLRKQEKSFRMGVWASVALSIISIPQFFRAHELHLSNPVLSLNVDLVLNLAEAVLQWVLLYSICAGSFKLAAIRGKGELAASVRFRWYFYFGCSALYMFSYPFVLNAEVTGLILISSLATAIAFLMILLVIRRVGRELAVPFEISA